MGSEADPTVLRSIAVTADDVVTAVEVRRTTSDRPVLRVTPPFSGRMRARLHVPVTDEYGSAPQPVHVTPESLLDATAPDYPRPAETEAAIRRDADGDYDVDSHYDRHAEAVRAWRAATADAIRDRASIDLPSGSHEVRVVVLGADDTG
ncbi:hypothetical protein ACKVMT_06865 [Halobacteriales archaeon Cl-PHB]